MLFEDPSSQIDIRFNMDNKEFEGRCVVGQSRSHYFNIPADEKGTSGRKNRCLQRLVGNRRFDA